MTDDLDAIKAARRTWENVRRQREAAEALVAELETREQNAKVTFHQTIRTSMARATEKPVDIREAAQITKSTLYFIVNRDDNYYTAKAGKETDQ
jgi:hypothetical protein